MNIQLFRYLTLAQLFQNAITGQKNNSRVYDARCFAAYFWRQRSVYHFVISPFLQLLGWDLLTMLRWHKAITCSPMTMRPGAKE